MDIFIKNINKHQRYTAFTLAEVLITLGIIGIVAAITIPALINNINDIQYKTALKKVYTVISEATKRIEADQGDPPWTATAAQMPGDVSTMFNLYSNYLTFTQTSSLSCAAYSNSIFASQYTTYKGSTQLGINYNFFHCYAPIGQLADGTSLLFQSLPNGVAYIGNKEIYSEIRVDVNGPKGPNAFGRDLFVLTILLNPDKSLSVAPAGLPGDANYTCTPGASQIYGLGSNGCAYYAINDLPMP